MPYQFEFNRSFWSLNFVEPYWKLFYQFKADVLELPGHSKYLAAQKDYNKAVQNYKVNHSPFKYGLIIFCLFFSWLGFIVLWFKNYAYYKKLKENKLALLKQIEVTKEKCLIASEAYANEIDIIDFVKDVYDLLKFQEVGPINQYLYHNIMENNGLDLTCSNTINPYQSSWGIWDKNKIVFNMNMQETITTMRTYTGSTVVSSTYDDENSITSLTATYDYPFSDVIIYHNRYFAYMHACERLNFKFNNESKLKSLTSKKQKLENDEFNRVFKFDYDDEIQYRMVFTPHKQEIMINEYQLNNKILLEDELNKSGPYLYTNYSTPTSLDTLIADANELLTKFKTNADFDILKYLKELGDVFYYGLQDLFKALKHLFTTPIMYSENHKTMINNALKDYSYEFYLPHYILNKVIKEEIIHYDSPCFNEIKSNTTIKLNKDELLYCCIMDGLSYKHEPRVINLPPDSVNAGGVGHKLIEVHYIETVPYHDQITFYYAPLITSQTRSTTLALEEILSQLTNAKQNKLDEIISEASSKDIIFYLKENFIAAKISNNRNYSQDEIKTYFQDIIKILKKK